MRQLSLIPGTPPEPQPIRHRTADISLCDRYRYRLTREWADDRPPATFIMLNPSTADADEDDATIGKCVRYSQRWGAGALIVVNLYAWRSTDPDLLPTGPEAVGPDNDARISEAALYALKTGGPLVAAWGTKAQPGRVADVLRLPGMGRLSCLVVTRDGHPGHPLYLRGTAPLVDWTPGGAA